MKENIIERMERIDAKTRIADFNAKMKMPYEFKVKYAAIRIREFIRECDNRDINYHVSVGGLDSITLLCFIRSMGIDCPAISVSYLEDKSIQIIHKKLGVECVKPIVKEVKEDGREIMWTQQSIIQERGFPVISKEVANKIEYLQNPTEKNRTFRHAIITGETGEFGGNRTGARVKLAQKWLDKFGGCDPEGGGAWLCSCAV